MMGQKTPQEATSEAIIPVLWHIHFHTLQMHLCVPLSFLVLSHTPNRPLIHLRTAHQHFDASC